MGLASLGVWVSPCFRSRLSRPRGFRPTKADPAVWVHRAHSEILTPTSSNSHPPTHSLNHSHSLTHKAHTLPPSRPPTTSTSSTLSSIIQTLFSIGIWSGARPHLPLLLRTFSAPVCSLSTRSFDSSPSVFHAQLHPPLLYKKRFTIVLIAARRVASASSSSPAAPETLQLPENTCTYSTKALQEQRQKRLSSFVPIISTTIDREKPTQSHPLVPSSLP